MFQHLPWYDILLVLNSVAYTGIGTAVQQCDTISEFTHRGPTICHAIFTSLDNVRQATNALHLRQTMIRCGLSDSVKNSLQMEYSNLTNLRYICLSAGSDFFLTVAIPSPVNTLQ
jgi:hypothetical protein